LSKARAAKAAAPARKAQGGPARTAGGPPAKAGTTKRPVEGYAKDARFLANQRAALLRERATYLEQAASLKAEAEALVEEMEPGDLQFDDESGEGGTVTVDRERDLALSAQALAAVEEIDHTLLKLDNGTYGICENCGRMIVKARLEALPYARLCIDCKSGGLSKR
jgi:DnaK suppressor protein